MALDKGPDHDSSSMDGPSVAQLLRKFQTDPEYKPLLDLRKKRSIHLYESFNADPTTIKLSCLLFDHVTTSELASNELDHLEGELETLESGDRAAGAIRRQARSMLRKASRFQAETKILRDEQVLVPFQWEGGQASMFQPASIGIGQLLFLGDSEMHELANEIAGAEPLRKIKPFATPFGLSCLRERVPEDIAHFDSDLTVAIAVSEIVGLLELFQMVPFAGAQPWHQALTIGMAARGGQAAPNNEAEFGISVLRAVLPNISLRSYEDTLEARVLLRDELLAFRHWISQQASQGKGGSARAEIAKTARRIATSTQDLQKKLQTADQRFLKDLARNLITASPPAILGFLIPSLHPAIGNAIGGMIAGWGVWDAVKDRRESRTVLAESNRAVTFLLKVKKHL